MLCLTQLEEQAKACSRGVKGDGWTLEVPIRIYSEMNERGGWRARHRRFKNQNRQVGWAMLARMGMSKWEEVRLPLVVTLTRIGVGTLDSDNLQGGFKAVRDAVAGVIGIDDADPRVEWRYAQERAKGYAVRIAIEERRA